VRCDGCFNGQTKSTLLVYSHAPHSNNITPSPPSQGSIDRKREEEGEKKAEEMNCSRGLVVAVVFAAALVLVFLSAPASANLVAYYTFNSTPSPSSPGERSLRSFFALSGIQRSELPYLCAVCRRVGDYSGIAGTCFTTVPSTPSPSRSFSSRFCGVAHARCVVYLSLF
jgi:hypothetical protein